MKGLCYPQPEMTTSMPCHTIMAFVSQNAEPYLPYPTNAVDAKPGLMLRPEIES
jgi:hypothetical protein